MKTKYIFISLIFNLLAVSLWAQEPVKGIVKDENGEAIRKAEVSINGSEAFVTNKDGVFQMMLIGGEPKKIDIKYKGNSLTIKKIDYQKAKNQLLITVEAIGSGYVHGTVVYKNGKAAVGLRVSLEGNFGGKFTETSPKGDFHLELPKGITIGDLKGLVLNGSLIKTSELHLLREGNNGRVSIQLDVPEAPKEQEIPKETVTIPPAETKQVVHVVKYDENSNPVQGVKVAIDSFQYVTDTAGRFEAYWEAPKIKVIEDLEFKVDGFNIVKRFYDDRNNHMYLYVRSPEEAFNLQANTADTAMVDYAVHFHRVVNQLEMRKQLLIEKSVHIREDIEGITTDLEKKPLSAEQRKRLTEHLQKLQLKLLETDLAFEQVEEQTHFLIDKMESVIMEKDQALHEIQDEFKRDIIIFVAVTIALLALAIGFYLVARRIGKQKKELEIQRLEIAKQKDEIAFQKDDIERAYRDIQELSAIGQEITSTLDFKTLIRKVNKHISTLMGAGSFGVGILNERDNVLEFMEYVQNNETTNRVVPLNSAGRLSVWCVRNKKSIFINDLENEWQNYLADEDYKIENKPSSLIYLPLVIEEKVIGVITVQSYKKNAYKPIDLEILKTLESYIAIALYNAHIFEEIKDKNKNITDSIRYAQTIQEAILPTSRQINSHVADHFIIYRSKDIVSGDFYWYSCIKEDQKDKIFLATIDCTGHGVPGAFMSMVGNNLLNEIINQRKMLDISDIMNILDEGVKHALKQEDKVNDDGMDICFVVLEENEDGTRKISFSGARRPLYYIAQADGKLQRLKGDMKSVGGGVNKDFRFTKQEISLQKGDLIYLTTDGYISQHNLQKEKIGTERFFKTLEDNAPLGMAQQKKALDELLNYHSIGVEQRDDITVIGLRL